MAKAGKKVLILEQHDQAGGCCHTFIDKGYEFDVGIHYIGKMGHPNINKTYMDQICDGQLEWKEMEVNIFLVSKTEFARASFYENKVLFTKPFQASPC